MSFKIGCGLRHTHFPFLLEKPKIKTNWFEVISENFMYSEGYPMEVLLNIRQDYPVALHGVSMNIAEADEIDMQYLKDLKKLIERVDPIVVSDHLCWTGKKNTNLHNLLPFPYTTENLNFVVEKIEKVQDFLGREIAIENLSAYLGFSDSEFTEYEFIQKVSDKSGCKILLDINNIYVNGKNQNFDPYDYLKAIKPDSIGEIHLAGHSDFGDYLFDTHSCPVKDEVWEMYSMVISQVSDVPVLVEWDEDIPEFSVLDFEVEKAQKIWKYHHEK